MIRLRHGLAALLALLAATPALARPVAVIGPNGPPQPSVTAPQLPAEPGAGWACSHDRCAYLKTSGRWGNCFTGWQPTHNAWRPVNFCH